MSYIIPAGHYDALLVSVIVINVSVNVTQGTGSARIESACPIRSVSSAK